MLIVVEFYPPLIYNGISIVLLHFRFFNKAPSRHMGEIFSMRTTWNQSIVKEMLTKFEQGPRIPTSLEQRLEKISYNSQKADLFSSNATSQFKSALHCTWIFCHFAKFYTSNCDFTRQSYTWWTILLDFALISCIDHDNWIMKGNTPKIFVDTKPERQC